MLMVAWREMTSGDKGVSSAGLSFVRSCVGQAALGSVSAKLPGVFMMSSWSD